MAIILIYCRLFKSTTIKLLHII